MQIVCKTGIPPITLHSISTPWFNTHCISVVFVNPRVLMWINLSEANWTFKMDKESLQSFKKVKKPLNTKYSHWYLYSYSRVMASDHNVLNGGLVILRALTTGCSVMWIHFIWHQRINLNFKSEVGLKIHTLMKCAMNARASGDFFYLNTNLSDIRAWCFLCSFL